jgi:hypothetical protein
LVALADIMRLSLKKGAHAVLSGAAWQEIRVRFGRDDKGEGDASMGEWPRTEGVFHHLEWRKTPRSSNYSLSNRCPFLCHPEAKPRDLRFHGPFVEMFFDRA